MSYLFSLKMTPSPSKKKTKKSQTQIHKDVPSFNFPKFLQASVRELFVLDSWKFPLYFS